MIDYYRLYMRKKIRSPWSGNDAHEGKKPDDIHSWIKWRGHGTGQGKGEGKSRGSETYASIGKFYPKKRCCVVVFGTNRVESGFFSIFGGSGRDPPIHPLGVNPHRGGTQKNRGSGQSSGSFSSRDLPVTEFLTGGLTSNG